MYVCNMWYVCMCKQYVACTRTPECTMGKGSWHEIALGRAKVPSFKETVQFVSAIEN